MGPRRKPGPFFCAGLDSDQEQRISPLRAAGVAGYALRTWPDFRAGGRDERPRIPERPMITGSICDCLVCRLEASLIAELGEEGVSSECTLLAASSSALSCFPSPLDLVRKLHTHEDGKHNSTADALLSELLKQSASAAFRSVCQRLLLLVFIPTIHRTASHVRAAFPSIARDDASQHVVCAFLEFSTPRNYRHTVPTSPFSSPGNSADTRFAGRFRNRGVPYPKKQAEIRLPRLRR